MTNPEHKRFRSALISVTDQIYSDWQLYIIEDLSTSLDDLTCYGLIRRRVLENPRIHWITASMPEALGLTVALSKCEWALWINQHDILKAGALLSVAKVIESKPDVCRVMDDSVFSVVQKNYINEAGEPELKRIEDSHVVRLPLVLQSEQPGFAP